MRISLSAPALAQIHDAFARAPALAQRELLATMTDVTMLLEREVKDAMPSVSGLTRASVTSDAFSVPAGVLGVVGSDSVAAAVLEFGRKAGKPISQLGREAIAAWAIEALGVEPKRADRVAFLVARKIVAHGLTAKKPFEKTLQRLEGHIVREFESAAARMAAALGGAA